VNPKAAQYFAKLFLIERSARAEKKILGFERSVEALIRHYSWPGNIRELENMVEFAVAMEQGARIKMSSLPAKLQDFATEHKIGLEGDETGQELKNGSTSQAESEPVIVARAVAPDAVGYLQLPLTMSYHESRGLFEKLYLEQVLRMCEGQLNLTSRRIGLNKVSLADKIRRHSIDWRKIRYESIGPGISNFQSA
jgi:DNA-binding NtrC family response regulator